MKSPRLLRPHSFILLSNRGEDENGSAIINKILIKHVRIDSSYGIKQSQKGIDTDDKVLITIDMNDYEAIPCEPVEFKKGHEIIINNNTYTINTIKQKSSIKNEFFFIELTAK